MIVLVVLMASTSMESTVTKVSDVVVEEIDYQILERKFVDSVMEDAMLLEELMAEVESIGTISPLKVGYLVPAHVERSRRTTTTAVRTDFKSVSTCYIFGQTNLPRGCTIGCAPS